MTGFCLIRGFWRERAELLHEHAAGFSLGVWLATNKTLSEANENASAALVAEIRTPMAGSSKLQDLDNLRLFFTDAANFAAQMYAERL
jgi:hypothetical protein